jgi:hypothetical protein
MADPEASKLTKESVQSTRQLRAHDPLKRRVHCEEAIKKRDRICLNQCVLPEHSDHCVDSFHSREFVVSILTRPM